MEFKTNRTRNVSNKIGNKFNKDSLNNFSALPNLKFTKNFVLIVNSYLNQRKKKKIKKE